MSDEPTIGRVDRDGFLLDVLSLDESLVATLDQSTEVMVDVMLGVPVVPGEMAIAFGLKRSAIQVGVFQFDPNAGSPKMAWWN